MTVWRLSGGATIVDDTGDIYRLRCGQAADQTYRLELIGDHVAWAEVSGNIDLYQGPPRVMALPIGELVVRAIGTRSWQKAPQTLAIGHYELGWRKGKELLDRRRIAVLPRQAKLERSGRGQGAGYALEGFAPTSLAPLAGAPVRVTSDGAWIPQPHAPVMHRFAARIDWPEAPSLEVSIRFPARPRSRAGTARFCRTTQPLRWMTCPIWWLSMKVRWNWWANCGEIVATART
jgi:hypothetical protein